MSDSVSYRTVVFEGGDQVGKGDASLNLFNRLLKENISVFYSSFPIYATPFGVLIRVSLNRDFKKGNITPEQELKLRIALFALNRLEFLDVFLSNSVYEDGIIILDRSSFSSAVTLGYGVANIKEAIKANKLEKHIEYALSLDSLFINKMNLKNCVIQLITKDIEWENLRGENCDSYENKDVQEITNRIYDTYQKEIGIGWTKVVTKDKKGWKSPKAISNEVYSFVESRIGKISNYKTSRGSIIRGEIGIMEILDSLYKVEPLPLQLLRKYSRGLRDNDKGVMCECGEKLGIEIGRSCKSIVFTNNEVKKAIKGIIEEIPLILDLAMEYISKEFVNNFTEALDE